MYENHLSERQKKMKCYTNQKPLVIFLAVASLTEITTLSYIIKNVWKCSSDENHCLFFLILWSNWIVIITNTVQAAINIHFSKPRPDQIKATIPDNILFLILSRISNSLRKILLFENLVMERTTKIYS